MSVNTIFSAADLNEAAFMLDTLQQIDVATDRGVESELAQRVYIPIGSELPLFLGGVDEEPMYYGRLVKDDHASWVFEPARQPESSWAIYTDAPRISGKAAAVSLPITAPSGKLVHPFFD